MELRIKDKELRAMKKYIYLFVTSLLMVSCVDTLILPDDKTVEEDFWKSKKHVQLMVNGAYQGMLSGDVISRLIVWGDLRSDEVIPATNITNTQQEDLTEINLANTQVDNQYANWASVYSVINRCNLVLTKAGAVMQEDPSYTEGDYLSDMSQMLALRSLCYFYLVRNFRDVPYITEAFTESSQNRNIPQSSPDSVLNACLKDLDMAEKNAISASAFTDWRRVGYFTRDGINALQADIHLWLGSVKHSASEYEQAVTYCNKVIDSKKSQHRAGHGEVEDKPYWLETGRLAYYYLFVEKNAEESIFELQYDGASNNNVGISQYFNHYDGKDGTIPYLYASSIFGYGAEVYTTGTNKADWRGTTTTYSNPVTVGDFNCLKIRKYVSSSVGTNSNDPSKTTSSEGTTYNSTLPMNYIVYRLTDIMLMKAEALTGLALLASEAAAANDKDTLDVAHLRPAFELVKFVNLRSLANENDSIKWNTYGTSSTSMENIILAERLRELAFEGKRWYDLMRYNYRHIKGVDYSKTLASQDDQSATFATTYSEMLNLVKRKLSGKGNAVAAKINNEPKLYMPIPLSDLNVCPMLRQNPGYSNNDNVNKNY